MLFNWLPTRSISPEGDSKEASRAGSHVSLFERNEWPRGKVTRRKLETPGGRAPLCTSSVALLHLRVRPQVPPTAPGGQPARPPLTLLGSSVLEQQEQQQEKPRPGGGVAARREGTAACAGQRGPAGGGGRGLASGTLRTVRGSQRSPARHRGGRQSARIVRAPRSPARPGPAAPGEDPSAAQRSAPRPPPPCFPLPAAHVASPRFPSQDPPNRSAADRRLGPWPSWDVLPPRS